MPQERTKMYLWLNCEGWVRFGPYEWLALDDERRTIRDQDGVEIARYVAGCWRTADEKYQGYQWCNPMITTSRIHPHPLRG